jgi:hypothetical protein
MPSWALTTLYGITSFDGSHAREGFRLPAADEEVEEEDESSMNETTSWLSLLRVFDVHGGMSRTITSPFSQPTLFGRVCTIQEGG